MAIDDGTSVAAQRVSSDRPADRAVTTLERYSRRTRRFHAAVYGVTLALLFTGWWLLAGHEGEPSLLARVVRQPDATIHQWLGWALVGLALLPLTFGRRGLSTFARETFRFDAGDATWLVRWPGAIISGRFARHEGHFDPGQRAANVVILGCLVALLASGVGLVVVSGGPAFVWLHRIHTWATVALTPVLAGHVLIALGVLPGYRGVWRSMHLGGRLPVQTAWRIWPGWTERLLTGSTPTGHRSG
jgi:formate dehydrogenase subunit gamma